MMVTVLHIISGLGLGKFQADGFLLTQVYQISTLVTIGVFLTLGIIFVKVQ